jgi:hypothetical protein
MDLEALDWARRISKLAEAAVAEAQRLKQQTWRELNTLCEQRDRIRREKVAIQTIATSLRSQIQRGD